MQIYNVRCVFEKLCPHWYRNPSVQPHIKAQRETYPCALTQLIHTAKIKQDSNERNPLTATKKIVKEHIVTLLQAD